MKRRTILSGAGALAAGTLAGCLAAAPGDEDPDPTDTDTQTSTLSDSTFTVEHVSSGNGDGSASVTVGEQVVVEGTIVGTNGCYTASLQSADYADGRLTVVVEAHERQDAEMCTQSLVDVTYRATFTFAGSPPESVTVKHARGDDVETVATVDG